MTRIVASSDVQQWQKENVTSFVEPNKMLQAMLQTALKERCKLTVHLTDGEAQGYSLVVAKRGPNWERLRKAAENKTIPSIAQDIADGGKMVTYMPNEEPGVTFLQTSMASFVSILPSFLSGPVEDKTGLAGRYDFKLMRPAPDGDPADMWDFGALGLKFVRTKVPTRILVIDHIERPSAN